MTFLERLTLEAPYVTSAAAALVVVLGAFAVYFFVYRGLALVLAAAHLQIEVMRPVKLMLKAFFFLVALVLILGIFGFNIGGLWGVITTVLAMVAIGFVAMWSILSNLLCTLIILISRPFAIGDTVEFTNEPVKGEVTDLSFFFTTLRDSDGALFRIPNNMFFQRSIKCRKGTNPVSLSLHLSRPLASQAVEHNDGV